MRETTFLQRLLEKESMAKITSDKCNANTSAIINEARRQQKEILQTTSDIITGQGVTKADKNNNKDSW